VRASIALALWLAAGVAAADPALLVDGEVSVGAVGGMPVLVRRMPGAELVALRLYVRGGARDEGEEEAGIGHLALAASASGGTASLGREAFAHRVARIGASLHGASRLDASLLGAEVLRAGWRETFALLVDAFLHPALPAPAVALERERMLAEQAHRLEDPETHLGLLAHRAFFRGHPYERDPLGSAETLARLDGPRVAAHLAGLRQTGRLLLVVAGDVDAAEVLAEAHRLLGGLPRGD
jgi:zinc protease